MKPAYAIYVLESEWTWDHFNRELATITVEGTEGHRYRQEFECIAESDCPERIKEKIVSELKDIAKSQNQCPMESTPRLIRLYRVIDHDGILLRRPRAGETPKLNFTMQIICEFDSHGNPTKPKIATV